jgi:hypothetical protein
MPASVSVVVVDNPLGVTSSQALTISDTLYLKQGTLSGPYTANFTTAVEQGAESIPGTCDLAQNYPNPFNPSTTITFSLARSGDVELAVYDLLGRKAETLMAGPRDAGTHSVRWDATGFSAGVYYLVMRSEGMVQTRTMLLVK